MPHVVAAPDSYRGTASAAEVAAAIAGAAEAAGWTCDRVPVSDGGEGLLDALGGKSRRTRVRGPLGEAVTAEWRLDEPAAVVEMAQAAGLELAGGPEWNDPMRATTAGVGDLVAAALAARATRIVVGTGGSATTDGGLGCVEALRPHARLAAVKLVVACDVDTSFVGAAQEFAAQKGASPAQVSLLTRRLERLAQLYEEEYGVDVTAIPGAGAGGGLAGGLAALGATLVPGFEVVAESTDLADRMAGSDLVVTGEGFLDEHSFEDRAVGGVAGLAAEAGVAVLVVVGEDFLPAEDRDGAIPPGVEVVSLVDRFGPERARSAATACITEAVRDHLLR